MGKTYYSVEEMIEDSDMDADIKRETLEYIKDRKLIKELVAARAVKNISRKQIAEAMECSYSKVARIENGKDSDLKVKDLKDYAEAVGLILHLRKITPTNAELRKMAQNSGPPEGFIEDNYEERPW